MAREPTTWIKLNRNILEWRWYWDETTFRVWIHLLLTAEIAEREIGKTILPRGSVLTNYQILAERLGLTYAQVRRSVENLKDTEEITTFQRGKFVEITILRYDDYQGENATKTQPKRNQNATDHYKNIKNIRNKETLTKVSVKKNGVFTPPSVEEVSAYCLERGNSVDPDSFVSFYESKGWMIGKNKMKDWKAAVRTWERSEKNKPKKKDIFSEDFWNDITGD